jgi:uncharacterized phiE125 gp8 family phage protein
MRVVVITGPTPFVDTATAKAHLNVTFANDDALIDAFIAAACGHLDGPDAWLGRAIGQQVLEARLHTFPPGYLRLGYPPLKTLTSVKYLDGAAADQTLDPSLYEVDDRGLQPVFNQAWPSGVCRENAVRVRYAAGYNTPPPAIVAAVLLMVGDLYANRETTVDGIVNAVPMSATAERLLAPYRVWQV